MKASVLAMAASAAAMAPLAAAPAAAQDEGASLVKCETSYGSVAITEGSNQGWNEYKLNSPRQLIAELIGQSGCFDLVNTASGAAATYLMTAEAGSKEEIDQAMSTASSAATTALAHSGALSAVSSVPGAGAVLGMLGGLGGKKKTITASLRLISPANGMTVAQASAERSKSVMKVMKADEWRGMNESTGGYTRSEDGRMISSAFLLAYNSLVAQAAAMPPVQPRAATGPAAEIYTVAVDCSMMAAASADAEALRSLRAGTELTPTGNREGLFVEVSDNYGTTGWVSVESLQ
ncbi:MAG: SH3 domain-containing protein [Pacificimonas sp.]|jgi:hypothetical protein|nr:SH3 domain-containing protein [Pacificimonas sp.]